MSFATRSGCLVLCAVVVSAAFAPSGGDRGGEGDVAKPGAGAGAGKAANNAPAAANPGANPAKAGKRKKSLDTNLVTALYRVGLQPERLAAARVSAQSVAGVVAGVKSWLAQHTTTLDDVDSRFASAQDSQNSLIRTVQSGLATKDQLGQLDTAVASLASITSERSGDLDAVFTAAVGGLTTDQQNALSQARANWLPWRLAVQFLVVNRSESDWVTLRNALDDERVSAAEGTDPDPTYQQFLATARADPTVAAAVTSLNTTLADVTTAWESAAAQQ